MNDTEKKIYKSEMSQFLDSQAFALICKVEDAELAKDLTAAVSDALIAKYRKGLDDGCKIGSGE